ncbi:hypothetical protein RF679_17610 [Undibacterium cyanobacteriorum]|uniref:Uncharacterized protein n=1 Tax=Undibacterium cyanobacteriorum TaxID=3073561 RepID=A0ABY9RID6_9BURK|nr:hypothetical protein [Undibacterium sp. 20NA77.5]WMW80439.1 hypothetical protein RF679_17610 [Undibacterium sp. 20NA77.5]
MAITWIKRLFELASDQQQAKPMVALRTLDQIKIPVSAPLEPEALKKNDDPLFGIKKGGKDVANKLFAAMSSDKGIHLESLLCALGSIAGYACQVSVREEFVRQQGRLEKEVFIVVDSTQNGSRYFFGDLLNKPLAESRYSIWSLSSGASQKLGLTSLIDLHDIFRHVTETLGQTSFGVPRLPQAHVARELPEDYVRHLWPQLFPIARRYCDKPDQWPILFGVAVQEILFASKGLIDPQLALQIVMESAIPMSKINLKEIA